MHSHQAGRRKKSDFVIYSCLLLKNSGFKEKTIKGQKALTMLGEIEIVNEMYNFAIIMFIVLKVLIKKETPQVPVARI